MGYFIYIIVYMNFPFLFDGVHCLFYRLTGFECAGCGSTRAIASILSGDIKSALRYNILAVAAFPVLLVILFFPGISKLLERRPYSLIIIFAVAFLFIIQKILKFQAL